MYKSLEKSKAQPRSRTASHLVLSEDRQFFRSVILFEGFHLGLRLDPVLDEDLVDLIHAQVRDEDLFEELIVVAKELDVGRFL